MEPILTMSRFAPSPYDWFPNKVASPTFENTDLYPAVTVKATRAKVGRFSDVVEREDDLGVCLVAHFEVFGTLVMFYQSALDSKDHWTVFVDMRGCVTREQLPTRLGEFVVRRLSQRSIVPEWVNTEADTEYRSRRKKLSQALANVTKLTATRQPKVSSPTTKAARSFHIAANDSGTQVLKTAAYAGSGMHLAAKKGRTSKVAAKKGATAPAKKAAGMVKKASTPRKAAVKKAAKTATAKKGVPPRK